MFPAVGPDDKLPLTETVHESAEHLDVHENTYYMYGKGELAESGLGSEEEALDPSTCTHRIIHVAPCKTDGQDDTDVENHDAEQSNVLETQLSPDPLTDMTNPLVEAGDREDQQGDTHIELYPPPPTPTSADSALLLTHAGEA